MCSSIYESLFGIGLKSIHKFSNFGILHQFLDIGINSEHYILFSWKMDWKMIDSWPFHMHGKFKDIVICLDRRDISCIKIGTNFITVELALSKQQF